SICMAIIREHNGDISAQPLADGGSVFSVSLPVCTKPMGLLEPAIAPLARKASPDRDPAILRGKRLLVIDDEEGIRELVGNSLSARGLSVDCAATAEEALNFSTRNSYDAILCDLHLAGPGLAISGL